jgi:anaerobic ribonucleoside-triphosphate reductase activating protein
MFSESFNIAHIEPSSQIYGPGNRLVIWLQGCTLACKGCWNTAMWSNKPNQLINRQNLLKQILDAENIEGITLLGGEPLQQVDNVIWLFEKITKSPLSIMLYSGYEYDEILSDDKRAFAVGSVDILISGRYRENQRNTNLLWRGSDNQKIIHLTERYKNLVLEECQQIEVNIDYLGGMTMLGYPE